MDLLHQLPERTKALAGRLRPYLTRRTMSLMMVIVGVGLLGYVATAYWGMYRSQRNLEAEWERQ
ncbi:MAG TPA: hypothetical protein VFT65_12610, partial [Candidatus Angelobacter sp.]|nr:hypothetical protein [Candidatus Angelobacter sp.]